ncbi:MAG: regulatory protein RecX [Desulfotomaculaceae bacterium]|nr:regulatory protein RecX [Desulfotomaculaceae bacterium]
MHSEVDKAMSIAFRVLAYRRRTTRELTDKLEEHGFSVEVTRSVIDTMSRYGYIDDKAYARLWIEQRLYKRGFPGLKRELMQKGVATSIIEETIAEAGPEAEFKAAFVLALKKLTQSGGDCPFPQLARFLQNRGYSYESINRVGRTITDNAG